MRERCLHSRSGSWCRMTVAVLLGAAACAKPDARQPISWESDRRVAGAVAMGASMVLLDGGIPAMRPAWTPVRWPSDPAACAETFIAAQGRGDTVYAAWRTGKDSMAAGVRVARSVNAGIAWDSSASIGSPEPATKGCTRPPPGVGVDTIAGAVHVVFHGTVGAAAGTFVASRTRNARGFAAPVLIAAGARPASASVAALGDTIAVVFEAPTLPEGVMWLAISTGASHIPTIRASLSAPGIRAFAPSVAVGRGVLGAAWNEARHGDQGPAAVARVGRWTR